MSRSILWRLIAKDLYFNRWLALLTVAGALISVWIASFNDIGLVIGLVTFVTTLIVYAVFVGQENVTRERREKVSTFILSLPVSTFEYTVAKLLAALLSYVPVWIVSAAVVVLLTLASPDSANGFIPMFLAIMGLMFMNFCLLLAVGIATTSTRWITATIVGTNTAVTLFMVGMFNLPSIQRTIEAEEIAWPPLIVSSFAVQAAVIALCFWFTLYSQSRRKDFI